MIRRYPTSISPEPPGGGRMRTDRAAGFSLVEALVALVVLSVGLAGIASLLLTGIKVNDSALLRTQATTHAYDIIDRMRANRGDTGTPGTAVAGAYDGVLLTYADSAGAGTGMADQDIEQWRAALAASSLPDWTAGVRRRAGNLFTVGVQWDDGRAKDPNQAGVASCLDDSDMAAEIQQVCVTTEL